MRPFLNLVLGLCEADVAVPIRVRDRQAAGARGRGGAGVLPEAERGGGDGEEPVFDGFDGSVDDGVDCVDDFVD